MRPRALRLSALALGLAVVCAAAFFSEHLSQAKVFAAFSKDSKPAAYALIFGTVYGPDDHPRQGVVIKIRRASDKKAKWEHLSDSHGEFAQRVPAGANDYVVWAHLKNRQAAEKTQITVHIDNDERRDISLHLPE